MAVTVRSAIEGHVAAGFERVRDEFDRNFSSRGELGAACAVYHRGQPVVDLWAGHRDAQGHPWEQDTLVLVFSVTKGLAAMAVAVAHSRGLFEFDQPVARYWPEFAQHGKGEITVRQLLTHQAGLCAIDEPLTPAKFADLDALADILARQRPAWPPGTRQGYHAFSLGAYESELVRRVDPKHRSLGHFFQDEVAGPLNLEFYIGLPSTVPSSRVAEIQPYQMLRMFTAVTSFSPRTLAAMLWPGSLTARVLGGNPRFGRPSNIDAPEWRRVELPSGNGIGQVRSVARAYGSFAMGAPELGITATTMLSLTEPAQPPALGTKDVIWQVDTCYGHGFWKPSKLFRFGSNQRAFGVNGAGGSFGFADPDLQLGYAYAPNRMGYRLFDDPREKALRDAVYLCIAEQ